MAVPAPTERDAVPPLLRAATWVSITALVVAAIICVVWVLIGRDDDVVIKALLTVVLLAGFAGVAIMEARLASRRPEWFVLTSMVTWVIILVIGALFIWMPIVSSEVFFTISMRILRYALVIAVFALGLQDVRLYLREHRRYVTPFTSAVAHVTVGLVSVLVLLIAAPLVLMEYLDFSDLYWRVAVAISVLAAVGTALLPLVRALFNPRPVRPPRRTRSWPTYPDGVTPLPVTQDGSPDWDAYHLARQRGQTPVDPARRAVTGENGHAPTPTGSTALPGPSGGVDPATSDGRQGSASAPSAPAAPRVMLPTLPYPTPTRVVTATPPSQDAQDSGPGSSPSAAAGSAPASSTGPGESAAPSSTAEYAPVSARVSAAASDPDPGSVSVSAPTPASAGTPATPAQVADPSGRTSAPPTAPPPVSARTVLGDARVATGASATATAVAPSPVYSRGLDGIPPRPPLPSLPMRAGVAPATAEATPAPLSARSHGWWGGRPSSDASAEPTMRWAEEPKDWPNVSTRRSGVRRRSGS